MVVRHIRLQQLLAGIQLAQGAAFQHVLDTGKVHSIEQAVLLGQCAIMGIHRCLPRCYCKVVPDISGAICYREKVVVSLARPSLLLWMLKPIRAGLASSGTLSL